MTLNIEKAREYLNNYFAPENVNECSDDDIQHILLGLYADKSLTGARIADLTDTEHPVGEFMSAIYSDTPDEAIAALHKRVFLEDE